MRGGARGLAKVSIRLLKGLNHGRGTLSRYWKRAWSSIKRELVDSRLRLMPVSSASRQKLRSHGVFCSGRFIWNEARWANADQATMGEVESLRAASYTLKLTVNATTRPVQAVARFLVSLRIAPCTDKPLAPIMPRTFSAPGAKLMSRMHLVSMAHFAPYQSFMI
jgi:hypothetical protein